MTGAATALPSDLSWEQFLELLDQDEYKNAELIDGQVVVVTPNWIHQRIVTTLIWLITNWVSAEPGRGEATFRGRAHEPPAPRDVRRRGAARHAVGIDQCQISWSNGSLSSRSSM
jgi:Uma2 family endonuclease